MANEMDELLAQLKTEYESKPPKSQPTPPPQKPQPQPSNTSESSDSSLFDDLLADVKTEVEKTETTVPQAPSDRQKPSTTSTRSANHERFLGELQQQQQATQKQQQEAAIAAKKRAEHREIRRRAALTEKARHWLQNLDLNSEEGKWFEEFSYSYESQLDAAVDYLQAMRESGL